MLNFKEPGTCCTLQSFDKKGFPCVALRDILFAKGFSLPSGLSLPRGPSFALPQKKQKGSRHIEFAKNQCQKPKRKKLACGSDSFSFLTVFDIDFLNANSMTAAPVRKYLLIFGLWPTRLLAPSLKMSTGHFLNARPCQKC